MTDADLELLRQLTEDSSPFNPDHCPAHLAESLKAYAEHGIPVGGFLEAVLANDLFEAVGRADHVNVRYLPAIVSFVYNRLPRNCHGSRERYLGWLAAHTKARSQEASER